MVCTWRTQPTHNARSARRVLTPTRRPVTPVRAARALLVLTPVLPTPLTAMFAQLDSLLPLLVPSAASLAVLVLTCQPMALTCSAHHAPRVPSPTRECAAVLSTRSAVHALCSTCQRISARHA